MATFGPPLRDTSSDYNEIYANPDERFGIKNPRTQKNDPRGKTRLDEGRRYRTGSRRYQGRQESSELEDELSPQNQKVMSRYADNTQNSRQAVSGTAANSTPSQKKKVHTSLLARARGITFGIVTMSWLVPVYVLWQLPISMVGAIMLGLSLQVETSYLLSAVDTAAQTVGSLFGYEYVDLKAIGMLAVVSAAGFGVVSACIAGFTAILWGLHPLSGNAAGTKMATFIVGVVGACIPFANMFPWIIFWILVMMRHPK